MRKIIVLHFLSQELNIMSTTLMSSGANSLGGIRMYKFFMLTKDNSILSSPFRCAECTLGKIKQKKQNFFISS